MKIICLVGMPGAGKGEVSKILEQERIPVVVMSSVVREEVKKRGLELNIKNLDMVGIDLREKFGRDIVAKRTAEKISRMKAKNICVDGLRNLEEIGILKKAGDAKIVAIDTPDDLRFKRLAKRGEDRDPKSSEEFMWRERKQLEFGLDKVMDKADYRIANDGTLEDLRKKVDKLLANIGRV